MSLVVLNATTVVDNFQKQRISETTKLNAKGVCVCEQMVNANM